MQAYREVLLANKLRLEEQSAKRSVKGPITRLISRPIQEFVWGMASAMLLRARKDQGRPLRVKRQISFDGSENPPPLSRDAVTSPLSAMSEDPPAPLLSP